MKNRFRRTLIIVSMGGFTLQMGLFGWGCSQFGASEPYTDFAVDLGSYAVQVGVDSVLPTTANNGTPAGDWLNDPLTDLYQNLWTSWIRHNRPEDPTFNQLLVN